jgi:hypothetical protein
MGTLRPKQLGDVPLGLSEHQREFLRKVKENIEILTGAIQGQLDASVVNPVSQAVVFDDLGEGSATGDDGSGLLTGFFHS